MTQRHEILSKSHIYVHPFHLREGEAVTPWPPTNPVPSSDHHHHHFSSKPRIPIPPAHPHLSFLWPSVCQNPWHLIPNLILPLTALINFLLLSFLPSLSLTLGYHFPLSALCVKASSSALFLAYVSALCLHRRNIRTTQTTAAGNIFLFFLLSSVTVWHLHTQVICLHAFLRSKHHQFLLPTQKTLFPPHKYLCSEPLRLPDLSPLASFKHITFLHSSLWLSLAEVSNDLDK